MEKFARGRRSIVYVDYVKGKKIAVKKRRRDIAVKTHLLNEARWLRKLNKYKIGPKLINANKDQISYEFIDGEFFLDWYDKAGLVDRKKAVKEIFLKMRILDKLKVNKEEMHHPVKHILIRKNKPYLIDFERVHLTKKPKNVTQFCQFLMSKAVNMNVDKINLRELLREYKKSYSDKAFKVILRVFNL